MTVYRAFVCYQIDSCGHLARMINPVQSPNVSIQAPDEEPDAETTKILARSVWSMVQT